MKSETAEIVWSGQIKGMRRLVALSRILAVSTDEILQGLVDRVKQST